MWKQAFCVAAVFSAAIVLFISKNDPLGAGLLCALVALPVLVLCLLLLEPKRVKIIERAVDLDSEGEAGCFTGEDELQKPERPKEDEEKRDLGGEGGVTK